MHLRRPTRPSTCLLHMFARSSTNGWGGLFLAVVYGYLVLRGAIMIGDGGEMLLDLKLAPGVIGGMRARQRPGGRGCLAGSWVHGSCWSTQQPKFPRAITWERLVRLMAGKFQAGDTPPLRSHACGCPSSSEKACRRWRLQLHAAKVTSVCGPEADLLQTLPSCESTCSTPQPSPSHMQQGWCFPSSAPSPLRLARSVICDKLVRHIYVA